VRVYEFLKPVDGKIISLLGRGLARAFPGCFKRQRASMPRCTGDAIDSAFRQHFVKVSPDALLNGECGISATYSAVGDLAGPEQAPDLGGQAQIASPAFIVMKAADELTAPGRARERDRAQVFEVWMRAERARLLRRPKIAQSHRIMC
jgi:hypothetical protein